MMPEYKMLWLLDLDYFWPHWLICKNIKRIIKKTTKLNLDGVNVWAGKTLNKEFIEGFINSDLLIYSWTVNSPRHARTLIECGIHGITSDRPSWMIKQLENNE